MATQGVLLPLTPSELLARLPRSIGTFLLDGGGADSWGSGEAFLGCEPSAIAITTPDGATVLRSGGNSRSLSSDPLEALQSLVGSRRDGAPAGAVPRERRAPAPAGGVVCALGYDLGRWIERLPPAPPDDLGVPILFAAVHPWVLVYSYRDRTYELRSRSCDEAELRRVAERLREWAEGPESAATEAQRDAGAKFAGTRRDAASTYPCPDSPVTAQLSPREYGRTVEQALDLIAAGDIYQVNLAQRFSAAPVESPAALFADWLARHPAPYAAYVDGGDWALVGNSPECFLRRDGREVATFPIKGTRPRGASPERDRLEIEALLASAKDRAEHVMIVDLERNDLGRVCEVGSIRVSELAQPRSFATLHHLESTVRGRLRHGVRLADLLRATFPGGSITGAPKIRAMEIIDSLEPSARRFYTGAVGFADGDDWLRLNIAIRTAVATPRVLAYCAGGGIVADSIPEREYAETLLKTEAFFRAVHGELR